MNRIKQKSSLIPSREPGKAILIEVDGQTITAYEGETVAASLLTAGITTFRISRKTQQPRGLYCGMGICYECLMTINGVHAQRACITLVSAGMKVETCKEMVL